MCSMSEKAKYLGNRKEMRIGEYSAEARGSKYFKEQVKKKKKCNEMYLRQLKGYTNNSNKKIRVVTIERKLRCLNRITI